LTADVVENLGGSLIVHARTSAGGEISVELRNTKVHPGESFAIGLQPSKAHFFDAEGDRLTGE
jgi:ABC-type sugar transport system ATPase subunit